MEFKAVHASSQKAYAQAQLRAEDIDFLEPHDAYTVISVLSLEGADFAKKGRGFELEMNGELIKN